MRELRSLVAICLMGCGGLQSPPSTRWQSCEDGQCPAGQACIAGTATRLCAAPCDARCTGQVACVDGACLAGCSTDADCTAINPKLRCGAVRDGLPVCL